MEAAPACGERRANPAVARTENKKGERLFIENGT